MCYKARQHRLVNLHCYQSLVFANTNSFDSSGTGLISTDCTMLESSCAGIIV